MTPKVTVNGDQIEYTTDGDGPVVVFVPSGGFGAWQWSWQYPAFAGPFQAITYHQRGTSNSSASTAVGVDQYINDLEAVLTDSDVSRVHLVGFGFGGIVALEYAYRFGRARSLVLIGTPAHNRVGLKRITDTFSVPRDNLDQLRTSTAHGFSTSFLEDHPEIRDQIVEWRQAEDGSREAWKDLEASYEAYDREWELYEMQLPTLVVHGENDQVVPPDNAKQLAEGLPHGREHRYEAAGHFVMIERAQEVNDTLYGFYERQLSSVPWES